jgi:hypothetical protein
VNDAFCIQRGTGCRRTFHFIVHWLFRGVDLQTSIKSCASACLHAAKWLLGHGRTRTACGKSSLCEQNVMHVGAGETLPLYGISIFAQLAAAKLQRKLNQAAMLNRFFCRPVA